MMTTDHKLDQIDLNILTALQQNGRIKNVDLAEKVALSASPCLQRVKRLEKMGFISCYQAIVEINKIVETIQVFTQITIGEHTLEDHSHFERQIVKRDESVGNHESRGPPRRPASPRQRMRSDHERQSHPSSASHGRRGRDWHAFAAGSVLNHH